MDEREPRAPVVVEKLPAKVQANEGEPVELTVVVQSELRASFSISTSIFFLWSFGELSMKQIVQNGGPMSRREHA